MGLSVADAYAQIKKLENSGQITLPEPQATVTMGTINPATGTFTWALPTLTQTTTLPLEQNQKTNTRINVTVGIVSTKAVDLRLRFLVIPQKTEQESAPVAREAKVAATPTPAAAATPVAAAIAATLASSTGVNLLETNGGVTIGEWPTVSSTASEIIVDAGFATSVALQGVRDISPPVSAIRATINFPNHPIIELQFFVLRPPVLGMGAFTIEALPMTIVYAPPQGAQKLNTATYADTSTLTRTVTTGVNNSTATKTAPAYTPADLVAKVAGGLAAVAAVVGTGGGAVAGASVAGALSELGSALFGGAKADSDSIADATKGLSDQANLFSAIMSGVEVATTSQQGTVTTETDNTLTIATASMNQWGSEAALGPGVGDRIVYLSNLKVAWVAVNGDVGISILGFDGFGANAVQDLLQEQASLVAGGQPRLGLSAAAIASLLSQDPLVPGTHVNTTLSQIGAPLIGPPRFVPAKPPGRSGSGTSTIGDIFQALFDTTNDSKTITTTNQTTITDAKPGWLGVVFGGQDNTETTITDSFTTTQTVDNSADDKMVTTITMFSTGPADAYNIKIFYDNTFGTYAIVDAASAVLQGSSLASELGPIIARR